MRAKVARDTTDPDRLYAQNHHGVYRSRDEGVTWDSIADGLPSDPYHPRRAPRRDVRRRRHPGRVYLGTRSGEVYASRDDGDSCSLVTAHRPEVLCVRTAQV